MRAPRRLRPGFNEERAAGILARLVGRFGLAAIVRAAFKIPETLP